MVIRNGLHWSGHAWSAGAGDPAQAGKSRTSYRGIAGQNQCCRDRPTASGASQSSAGGCGRQMRSILLPVVLQHLIACFADLGTIFLEAGQNGEIALIDQLAAEALNISGTSFLLFRRAAALLLG